MLFIFQFDVVHHHVCVVCVGNIYTLNHTVRLFNGLILSNSIIIKYDLVALNRIHPNLNTHIQ